MSGIRSIAGGLLVSVALAAMAQAAEPAQAVLFRNVNVVSMASPEVTPGRDVLVRAGRIERIAKSGSLQAPAEAFVVEGGGRYLMPGLSEMHAHLPGPAQKQAAYDLLLLYLAHGITTIRGMLGDPWHLELREQLEKHEVLGPRLFTAGPSFNGNSVPDPARAGEMVREQARAGYDFLKLHPGLSREVFDAIVAAAREADIPFEGHVSQDVGLLHALESKQRAIDHLDGYVQALADPECASGSTASGFFGLGVVQCVDEARIPDLVRRTKEAGIWMVPTAILLVQWARPPSQQELLARPAARYMPQKVLLGWFDQLRRFTGGQSLPAERGEKYVSVVRALLRELHAQGVPFLLGSDSPQVFNIPGDSALAELALYADVGLSPYEALRTGTVNPATFFGAADRFGTVQEGMEADLILVAANPLQDVSAVRRLAGVMVRGKWLSRAELDKRLNELAARAAQQS